MNHILDNPAWNALISGNKHLAKGNNQIRYFDKEVSPFVAFEENSMENFELLYEQITHAEPLVFVTSDKTEIPDAWKVLYLISGLQMVYDVPTTITDTDSSIVSLTNEHIPQMLSLTKLTNPGPFAERTIEFGHYKGIFDGDKLVAMAGQRMHAFEYAEISAVCTHPDYTGRGYAKLLLLQQINRIKAAAGIPFLHVRDDNERAIKVYESLGFAARKPIYFYVIQKN
ncbi:GNAT family N-acetyltransferase [Mucilaginibacter sabulilitoris]|uniref:GNAT family N-acetyltransferase n=1 Tax=Mucilaginibacter sabulilitoris TaxID=1173583 RepID=A0ABZ0TM57_9SPHI|nr:GNAT family N-acetyltransferase [Mucilaginibacter sabulilitoris]WPU94247.1 GNAT family N-acetyltransferase [Mucilaginibacter sabulilitoris]